MANNTYEILKSVLVSDNLDTINNTYECLKAVYSEDDEALRVNVQNLPTPYGPTKVFKAIIRQVGSNAPTIDVVLQNTLGVTPVFGYLGVGSYSLTVTGAFATFYTRIWIDLPSAIGHWRSTVQDYDTTWIETTNVANVNANDILASYYLMTIEVYE